MSVLFTSATSDSIRQDLDIPSLNNVPGASLTCWFTAISLPPGPADPATKYTLVSSGCGPPGTPPLTNRSRIEIEIENDPGAGGPARFNIVCRALDSDSNSDIAGPSNTVPIGVPTFVVITVDYTTREGRIYKNGVFIGSGLGTNLTAGNTSPTNGDDGSIGSEDSGTPELFNGWIEDARVYSRVLSANEILTMYTCQGIDGIVFGLEQRYELQSGFDRQLVSQVSPQDSARQKLNGSVPNGSPTYAPSITPTFRRRLP